MSDNSSKADSSFNKTVLAPSGSGPLSSSPPEAEPDQGGMSVADTFMAPGGMDASGRPITGPTLMATPSQAPGPVTGPVTGQGLSHATVLGASGAAAARFGGPRQAITGPEIAALSSDPLAGVLPTMNPESLVGTVVADRYRILKLLGQGGMGVVYLAEHVVIEKRVALKLLNEELTHSRDAVSRFIYEAKAASKIGHENIIDINDFGTLPEGGVFFVMEFLDGCDLSDLLKAKGRLTWEKSRTIGIQVCRALAAAHGKGIIHRDLKPENIFLITQGGREDFVKILDFGIAKFTGLEGGAPKQTKTGMIFGTPDYMAPEQAEARNADHRVDIYSLGIILYQLVTGRLPFQAETFMGVLHQHMTKIPTPPMEVEPSLPPAFDAIIRKTLEKNPDDRFQTMQEVSEALEQLGEAAPAVSGAPALATAPAPAPVAQAAPSASRTTAVVPPPGTKTEAVAVLSTGKKKGSGALMALVFVGVALLAAGGFLVHHLTRNKGPSGSDSKPSAPKTASAPEADAQPATPRRVDARPAVDRPSSPNLVRINVSTTPKRAEVLLDGESVGHTPLTDLLVPVGQTEHVILLKKPGYRSQEIRFVPDSNQSWERILERGRGVTRVEPERPPPMGERPPPMVERPPPMVERPPPMVERPPPMVERPPPMVGRPPPMDSDLKTPF